MLTLHHVPEEEWPDVSRCFADLTFEQSLTYSQAAAARIGARVTYVIIEDTGQLVAAAAIRIKTVPGLGRGIAWIASGPLLKQINRPLVSENRIAAILDKLREEFCDRRGHILRFRIAGTAFLSPEEITLAAQRAGFLPTTRAPSYQSFAIDAQRSSEELMAQFHGKWRGHLRAALKAGLRLDRGTGSAYEARFLRLFEVMQSSKGFKRPAISPEFHFSLCGLDYTSEILIAVKDGEDIAGIVAGGSGPANVYLFGATDAKGRKAQAGYFLAWEGIGRTKEKGLDWYDLGGVDTVDNPAVAEFKTRMNGRPILAEPFEARPRGSVSHIISGIEALRARLRRS